VNSKHSLEISVSAVLALVGYERVLRLYSNLFPLTPKEYTQEMNSSHIIGSKDDLIQILDNHFKNYGVEYHWGDPPSQSAAEIIEECLERYENECRL